MQPREDYSNLLCCREGCFGELVVFGENEPLTFRNVARPLSISSGIGYDLPTYTPNRIHVSTTGPLYIGQHIPYSFPSETLHLTRS